MIWVFTISLLFLVGLFTLKHFETKQGEKLFWGNIRSQADKTAAGWFSSLREFFQRSSGSIKHHSKRTTRAGKSRISRLLRRLAERLE